MNSQTTTENLESPELLAPAGNMLCARAAVENGADAIYFGLQSGFNARARADNITFDQLPELMSFLHRRGVKGYTTLNTLTFTDELPRMENAIQQIARAGVDAVLVQDFGVAMLAKKVCPDLEIHASTQMTLTDAKAIELSKQLGVKRAVLPRELSLKEIERIKKRTDVPLEVFVHGALCVAYSGQCLTSESLGGRSANRGMCAQACRLPYNLFVDGQPRNLGDVRYLLSPQDLAAFRLVPELVSLGIASLKIEGRLKTPEYVANIVSHYRNAIDSAVAGQPFQFSDLDQMEMELSFSRGFSPGWLEGNNHKRLVPGLSSAKKGVYIGKLIAANKNHLKVQLEKPIAAGDGIVLEGDRVAGKEFGGRVFRVVDSKGNPVKGSLSGIINLEFERGLISQSIQKGCEFFEGQKIWKTDDPKLNKRLRRSFQGEKPVRTVPVKIHCQIETGVPLRFVATFKNQTLEIEHEFLPETARKHPVSQSVLAEQLGRFGGTELHLEDLTAEITGSPMVPLSVLGSIRKELVSRILEKLDPPVRRTVSEQSVISSLLGKTEKNQNSADQTSPKIRILCRSLSQIENVLACGIKDIIAEFQDIREYKEAIEMVRQQGGVIELASLRIHKPGEDGLLKVLKRSAPDSVLVRNLIAADMAKENEIPFTVDFSLNISNPISAKWWTDFGASRITPSFDLNREQIIELTSAMNPAEMEVVIHQHIPMFHMEHCVFCSILSPGTNKHTCGRPCDEHVVQLEDRVGAKHHLRADIGCRNTLYNAKAQSGAETAWKLVQLGVRQFRIELLNDLGRNEIEKILRLYRQLLDGKIEGKKVWTELNADNRIGVTRGTMEQPRNPLAIL